MLCIASITLKAQSYGLRFAGQEEIQDNRTSLNLTPEKPLCLNGTVDITFDLSLASSYTTYFGYIFRIIQNEKQNLDLLYEQKSKSFKIIIGERFSKSVIKIDSAQLFDHWNQFRLQIDLKNSTLLVYTNNKLVIRDQVPFGEGDCFTIFFGGNEFRNFKSKDLPPMNLKDITLSEDGEQRYHWPLNELNGTTATDVLAGKTASVKNPIWIKSLHNEWKLAKQFTVNGSACVAFDPASETVHVIGSDILYRYSVRSRQGEALPQKNFPPSFLPGNQAIFNPSANKLYNYYVDQKSISAFDSVSRSWKSETLTPKYTIATEYWQANKFITGSGSDLYILGGYGQLTYKNSIHRYRFATKKWETIPTKGTVYTPRYLAALGTTPGADTAYLIGGYGSLTGEQMLNPKSAYDLLEYVVKENTFRKLYELPVPKADFAFANSLVVDSKSNLFYGLIFPNQQFKSHLQLIRGSLSKPTYELVGTSIPYQFHDTHSYSDLYFCPASRQLVAVTLYRNEKNTAAIKNTTDVKLYTISFPPNALEPNRSVQKQPFKKYWLWVLAGLVAGGFVLIYARRRRQLVSRGTRPILLSEQSPARGVAVDEPSIASDFVDKPVFRASVFLFGNFQVFDHTGSDITKLFTPLLKELFLLLALNNIGKQRGVPSEKLNEILWPDKSGRDASNNRSVNIAKLRSILEKAGACSLSKESGYWNVSFDFNQIYVDYERYMAIINNKATLTKQTIIELEEITKRGPFLLNTEYYWLDDFKADISNNIINTFLQYADKLSINDDPEFLIQLTNFIFYYDPVNEDAIILKCKSLALMGKHTLAKNAFEKFTRDYKIIYGEDYKQSFSAFMD
jgi:DNA-binding SARP family transcriptional activator